MSEERVRFTGRDLTEALAAARAHFGLPRHEIAFEILSRPKTGLLEADTGRYEIEAWANPGAPPPVEREPRFGRGDRDRGGRGGRGDRERGGRGGRFDHDRGDRGGRHERDRSGGDDRRARESEEAPETLPILPGPEVTEIPALLDHVARAFIGGLGLELQVEGIDQNEVGTRVRLVGEDVPLLLESEGEGLEALQYLANRALQKDGRLPGRVSFDAGGWRARSEEKLVETAREVARAVLESGQPRKMPSMGPYERRLVHLALAEIEGIKTFSTGSGYHRRLHISPAGSDAPTDAEAAHGEE